MSLRFLLPSMKVQSRNVAIQADGFPFQFSVEANEQVEFAQAGIVGINFQEGSKCQ
jgi:hypothetical protein